MRNEPANRLDLSALIYWKWKGFLSSLFWWLAPLAYYFTIRFLEWPEWILGVLIIACVCITILATPLFQKSPGKDGVMMYSIRRLIFYTDGGFGNGRLYLWYGFSMLILSRAL